MHTTLAAGRQEASPGDAKATDPDANLSTARATGLQFPRSHIADPMTSKSTCRLPRRDRARRFATASLRMEGIMPSHARPERLKKGLFRFGCPKIKYPRLRPAKRRRPKNRTIDDPAQSSKRAFPLLRRLEQSAVTRLGGLPRVAVSYPPGECPPVRETKTRCRSERGNRQIFAEY